MDIYFSKRKLLINKLFNIVKYIRIRSKVMLLQYKLLRLLTSKNLLKKNNRSNCTNSKTLFMLGQCINPSSVLDSLAVSESLLSTGFGKTDIYVCNGFLSVCEFSEPYGADFKKNKNCNRCKSFAKKLINKARDSTINVISLGSIEIKPLYQKAIDSLVNDLKSETSYKLLDREFLGVNLNEHIKSSFCRQTLKGFPEVLLKNDYIRLEKIFINCVRMIAIQKTILSNKDYNRVIMPHGMYLLHGPLTDLCSMSSIDTSIYDAHYRRGSYLVSKGQTCHKQFRDAFPLKIWDIELSKFETEKAKSYIFSKEKNMCLYDSHSYYKDQPEKHKENILSVIKVDSNKKIYSLFTNVDWDAQLEYVGVAYNSQLEWIKSTIDFFTNSTDSELIIKIHPAELDSNKSHNSLYDPIHEYINNNNININNNNIHLLPHSLNVTSYDIMKLTSVSLVYGSNIALETTIRNIPTIVAGSCDFAQREIMYTPNNEHEYIKLLESDVKIFADQVNKSIKFAYFYYFRMCQLSAWSSNLISLTPKIKKMTLADKQDTAFAFIHGTGGFDKLN
jgi:hypothetical protein